jgi:hypothetical protein
MRVVLFSLALGLVLGGAASASHLDPQEQIRPADQKRAAAMLVRASDVPGYTVERVSDLEPHVECPGLDESDLVLTGRAVAPYRSRDYRIVGSTAAVYRTRADSNAAWRRGTTPAARRCLRQAFLAQLERQGETVRVTVEPLALPPLAAQRAGYRVVLTGATAGQQPVATLDVVLLRVGRAQAALLFAAVVVPPDPTARITIARTVAERMRKVMRGAS